MGSVNIRISHHDDFVIPGLRNIKSSARPCPHDLDDGRAFLISEYLRNRSLLDIKYFPPDRKQRLEH